MGGWGHVGGVEMLWRMVGFFRGGGVGGVWRRTIQATMKISVYQHEGEEQGLTESCLELLFTTSSEGDYCPN